MLSQLKSALSKINFSLGGNPKVEKKSNWREFIPEPYKAVITITADFELAWAWRYSKSVKKPLERAYRKAKQERENIPIILSLCEKYQIPITWATVGHLFLSECKRQEGIPHKNLMRLHNFENQYWKYDGNDWFEYDPCTNYQEAPEWYAPDLINLIINSNVKHEIGCHTFSHIDCSDEICPAEVLENEILECKKEAAKYGIELKSFVHPGHTISNIKSLKKLGFTSYQTDPGNILGYPEQLDNNLWKLKRTYEFVWRDGWSVDYHIYRYKTIIDRAIKNNSVCNLWFHPSFEKIFSEKVLSNVFEYISRNRDKVLVTTVGDYFHRLNENAR